LFKASDTAIDYVLAFKDDPCFLPFLISFETRLSSLPKGKEPISEWYYECCTQISPTLRGLAIKREYKTEQLREKKDIIVRMVIQDAAL
jgi:hypothetical protein